MIIIYIIIFKHFPQYSYLHNYFLQGLNLNSTNRKKRKITPKEKLTRKKTKNESEWIERQKNI